MEDDLRAHLIACATLYGAHEGMKLTTVGRICARDWGFFERISDSKKSFTIRTYDNIIEWFDKNWPENLDWPEEFGRPSKSCMKCDSISSNSSAEARP